MPTRTPLAFEYAEPWPMPRRKLRAMGVGMVGSRTGEGLSGGMGSVISGAGTSGPGGGAGAGAGVGTVLGGAGTSARSP